MVSLAQYPQHFTYDDENGLPSNEVYSIVQDSRGFIWLGTNSGLYKFDGVRYLHYTSPKQLTNSAANLVISAQGNIYFMNFKNQVFKLEDGNLIELSHAMNKINNITSNGDDQIWFTHDHGISVYDELSETWTTFNNFGSANAFCDQAYCNSARKLTDGSICFINTNGLGSIKDLNFTQKSSIDSILVPGKYMIEPLANSLLLIQTDGSGVYEFMNDQLVASQCNGLQELLANRKITQIKTLKDNQVWICTYSGIITYDPVKNVSQLRYPKVAFSDVLLDREGNYWFSTLQAGVFRVPNLNYVVWNANNDQIENEKLTHLTGDDQFIYFSNVNGIIQKLDPESGKLFSYSNSLQSDIQCLNYLTADHTVAYYQGTRTYLLNTTQSVPLLPDQIYSVKHIEKVDDDYCFSTSSGLIIHPSGKPWTGESIIKSWCRATRLDKKNQQLYAATNDGLIILSKKGPKWDIEDTLLPYQQINSFDLNPISSILYLLTYDGQIQCFKNQQLLNSIAIPDGLQAKILKYHEDQIYIGTNKGLLKYDLITAQFTLLDRFYGLASNNVQDLFIRENQIWLATGKGLQSIPIPFSDQPNTAIVYLKNKELNTASIQLNYGTPFVLYPEVSNYMSHGDFSYLYKVNDNEWVALPADIEQIEILNLPSGAFQIMIKAQDHLGNDSENVIVITGHVYPPFWKRWWFLTLLGALVLSIIFFFVKRELNKQRKEMKRQNELNLAKLTAIRSQLNPHFMFNTLNSLQDLILKQDFKNTNYYLSKFAALMRMILHNSEVNYLKLSDEIKMIQMYMELEQLRFGDDFTFSIQLDETIEAEEWEIPSLMIQPYIENAVKHGLLHKKGPKNLTISFQSQPDHLICNVIDNGVGRKKSTEINARQRATHKSFSSDANQQRANILSNQSNRNYQIEIIDLEADNEPLGTKVILKIPIKNR